MLDEELRGLEVPGPDRVAQSGDALAAEVRPRLWGLGGCCGSAGGLYLWAPVKGTSQTIMTGSICGLPHVNLAKGHAAEVPWTMLRNIHSPMSAMAVVSVAAIPTLKSCPQADRIALTKP